jgi:hypothetical protein
MPWTTCTATSTAKVLMAQFPRKRRIFFVPGCMFFVEKQRFTKNASVCRRKQGTNLKGGEVTRRT